MNWIPPRLLRILAIVSALGVGGPSQAQNETEVDLALVLAVDVSRSMDDDEQRLQRDGFVEAFRSAAVHDAIHKGVLGRIAVVYMEWSGPTEQKVVLPWTVIDGPERALAFSGRLAQAPIGRIFSTSISGAIDYGLRLLGESGVDPLRRVIDVSGRPEQHRPHGHARPRRGGPAGRDDQRPSVHAEAPDRLRRHREPRSLLPGLRDRRAGRVHRAGARGASLRRSRPDQARPGDRRRFRARAADQAGAGAGAHELPDRRDHAAAAIWTVTPKSRAALQGRWWSEQPAANRSPPPRTGNFRCFGP